jgi:hypothetical protein
MLSYNVVDFSLLCHPWKFIDLIVYFKQYNNINILISNFYPFTFPLIEQQPCRVISKYPLILLSEGVWILLTVCWKAQYLIYISVDRTWSKALGKV